MNPQYGLKIKAFGEAWKNRETDQELFLLSQSLINSLVNWRGPGSGVAPLVEQVHFDSNTNCLGRRRLVKAGSLMKLRSGRELVAFLFSDFILLTQVKGGGSIRVEDVFRSERAQQAHHKHYR
jgi:hypothetical protein